MRPGSLARPGTARPDPPSSRRRSPLPGCPRTPDGVLARLGLTIAVGGVGTAIWFTSKVLVPRLITPAVLKRAGRAAPTSPRGSGLWVRLPAFLQPTGQRELAALKELIDEEPAEFFGIAAASVDGLFARRPSAGS